jgi:hypothetical protein
VKSKLKIQFSLFESGELTAKDANGEQKELYANFANWREGGIQFARIRVKVFWRHRCALPPYFKTLARGFMRNWI